MRRPGTTNTSDEAPRKLDPLLRFEQALTKFRSLEDTTQERTAFNGDVPSKARPVGQRILPRTLDVRENASPSSPSGPRRLINHDPAATADDIWTSNSVRSTSPQQEISQVDFGSESALSKCQSVGDVFIDLTRVARSQPIEGTGGRLHGRLSRYASVPSSALRRACSVADVATTVVNHQHAADHEDLRLPAATLPPQTAATSTSLLSKSAFSESAEPQTMKSFLNVRLQINGRMTSRGGDSQRSIHILLTNN